MLCDEILSRESYDTKVRAMGEDIASANYQQVPIDIKENFIARLKPMKIFLETMMAILSFLR